MGARRAARGHGGACRVGANVKAEDAECVALCEWFAIAYPQHARKLIHVSNEAGMEGRDKGAFLGAMKKRRRMGVVSGVADYFLSIPCPPKSQCGLWLEVKAPGGPLKRDQIAFLESMAPCYGAAVAWGWVGASYIIGSYLGTSMLPLGVVVGATEATMRPMEEFTLTGKIRRDRHEQH
jgi:hypothetical protein